MTALSDYTDSVATLRTAISTITTDAADVVAKAATAKVLIGDDVQAILLRAAQLKTVNDVLTAHGNTSTAPSRFYLDGVGLDIGTDL